MVCATCSTAVPALTPKGECWMCVFQRSYRPDFWTSARALAYAIREKAQ